MDKDKDGIEIDLQEIFTAILAKSWIIILAMLICAALAFGYTKEFVEPKYSSDAMLFVNASSSVGDIDFSISASEVSLGENLIDTYMVILMTRNTLNDIIEYVGCDYTTSQLSSKISVSSVNDTAIFKVVVTDVDPYLAEEIATAITIILPEKISEIIDGTSVRIVDTAIVNNYPISPDYTKNTMYGAVFGIIVSLGVIVLLKLFEKKITSVDYIKTNYSQIPLLGVIPVIGEENKNKKYYNNYN